MAYYERTRYRLGFGGGLTTTIKYLLILNTAIYILQELTSLGQPFEASVLMEWFSLQPGLVWSHFFIWQLFTYMFLHGGTLHLVINMFMLWMFGGEVERALGAKEFLKYYIICGVGAGFFHMLVNSAGVVGASGAIFGVMAAFAILFPDRVITLLLFLVLPVQMKAKYFVLIFAGVSLLLGSFGSEDGIAHFAHLGGMLVGFAYLKLDWRIERFGGWVRQKQESRKAVQSLKKDQAMQQIREQVDEILDKINEVGYEQLSDQEKKLLQEASEKFSQEKEANN